MIEFPCNHFLNNKINLIFFSGFPILISIQFSSIFNRSSTPAFKENREYPEHNNNNITHLHSCIHTVKANTNIKKTFDDYYLLYFSDSSNPPNH